MSTGAVTKTRGTGNSMQVYCKVRCIKLYTSRILINNNAVAGGEVFQKYYTKFGKMCLKMCMS